MKSYLEIEVPITFEAPWFIELRDSLKDMPVLATPAMMAVVSTSKGFLSNYNVSRIRYLFMFSGHQ